MGAWGCGLLQNDVTQDALIRFLDGIEADVIRLGDQPPTPESAGRLAGVVGLLLQLQAGHCFDPEYELSTTLQAELERHAPAFPALPKTAQDLFGAIRAGKGLELLDQEGKLPPKLSEAFFEAKPGFLTERGTGVRHAGLFEHPASVAYVQEVADRCVTEVSAGFNDLGRPPDMANENGDAIAALSVLLQLEPCRVSAEHFREWWARYRAAWEEDEEDEDEAPYSRCLWKALNWGLRRFSGRRKPAPLEWDGAVEG